MGFAVQSTRWWEEPTEKKFGALTTLWNIVREENQWQYDADEYHLGLYCLLYTSDAADE